MQPSPWTGLPLSPKPFFFHGAQKGASELICASGRVVQPLVPTSKSSSVCLVCGGSQTTLRPPAGQAKRGWGSATAVCRTVHTNTGGTEQNMQASREGRAPSCGMNVFPLHICRRAVLTFLVRHNMGVASSLFFFFF